MSLSCFWAEPLYIGQMFSKDVRQPSSRRFQLRTSTAAEHEMLDAMVGTFSDRASYEAYVRSIYAFRLPLERALARARLPESFLPWSPLLIGEALERDVNVLNLGKSDDLRSSPEIETTEQLYGLLYTLEGSSLGAQILVKRAAALGFEADTGASHLVRQAGSIGSWRSFCDHLEAEPSLDMSEVSASACGTFRRARECFSKHQAAGSLMA